MATPLFEEGGGLDNRKNSNPTVTNCVFIGNTATSGGGGMHNYVGNAIATGNPTITNCLFAGNSAAAGAGMRNNDPSPLITNSTFVDNLGSGISNRNGSVPLLFNCILRGNAGGSFSGANAPIVMFSDVEGGFTGPGNIDTDPVFADPDGADNDATTWTDNDYRLGSGSPCIDAADNASVPPDTADLDSDGNTNESTPLDLGGNPRIASPCGEPLTVDMGAFEFLSRKTIFFADNTTLTWTVVTGAQSYNVYKGRLSDLSDGDLDGLPDNGYGECVNHLDADNSDTVHVDYEIPASGTGDFFLMSYVDEVGTEVGLDTTSACLPRNVPIPCP